MARIRPQTERKYRNMLERLINEKNFKYDFWRRFKVDAQISTFLKRTGNIEQLSNGLWRFTNWDIDHLIKVIIQETEISVQQTKEKKAKLKAQKKWEQEFSEDIASEAYEDKIKAALALLKSDGRYRVSKVTIEDLF